MNKHITENIKYYLDLESPEYALLISGKWGSGKTYFINDFVDSSEDDDYRKFVKISLFGLKDISSIDEQIFQVLHPILGSKYARLTGNIAKSAFKLGVNLDWDGDGNKDGSISTDLGGFNLLDFFSNKDKKNKELVFIFDDLERTDISLKEVLGYINYLVEISSFKVIVLANENKLLAKTSSEDIYEGFKEKVIGKTFEVRHDFSKILDHFISDVAIGSPYFDKRAVFNAYENSGYNNLRHVRQSLIDFKYLVGKIEKRFLECDEFISQLAKVFFALSIEAKHGVLGEGDFSEFNPFVSGIFGGERKEISTMGKVIEKHKLGSQLLLNMDLWIKIIYKSYINEVELNSFIKGLPIFVVKEERPAWIKLWYFRELEDDEFKVNLDVVISEFKDCVYESPVLCLHAVALLVFFKKNNMSDFDLDEIKNGVDRFLNKELVPRDSYDRSYEEGSILNETGLGYMCRDDPDFKGLYELIDDKSKNLSAEIKKKKSDDELRLLLESIKKGNGRHIDEFLLRGNEWLPVFNNLDPDDFIEALSVSSNKSLFEFLDVLYSRYSENRSLNNRSCYYHLFEELGFWDALKLRVKECEFQELPIKTLFFKNLERHIDFIINKIISEVI